MRYEAKYHHTAAAVKRGVMAAAMDVVAVVVVAAALKVQRHGEIVVLATMVIHYSRAGTVPRGDPNW